LKDAARLLVYLIAVVLIGALLAPPLYWLGHGISPAFKNVDFESFFHRALLVAALLLLWPLLRSVRVRGLRDLGLERNRRWGRDLLAGLIMAAGPLLLCAAALIALHVFTLRHSLGWARLLSVLGAAIAAPAIEETFFRGLLLGILLRARQTWFAILATSAFFSIVHFLKAPDHTSVDVTWFSGFGSILHSFAQFTDPILVVAGFTTLFLIGWILADARVRTRSLWLPAGLHAGWIVAAGTFSKITRREILALPWLGKNLMVGLVPLGVGLITWLLLRLWIRYDRPGQT
jgi:membrane protease YdiL (CAAX protease family)